MKHSLRSDFTESPGAPDLPSFRLIDMYTKCQEVDVKESILILL